MNIVVKSPVKHLFPLFLLLMVSSCANRSNNLIIAPQIIDQFTPIYSHSTINLSVVDLRNNKNIMQILQSDKAAKLINSTISIQQILTTKFTSIFGQQGLNIIDNSATKMGIFIDTALISVQQSLLKYQVKDKIQLRISITNQHATLNKTFHMHGKSNGPLTADSAVLERDFNQQLGQLIQQIVTDKEIQLFLSTQKKQKMTKKEGKVK